MADETAPTSRKVTDASPTPLYYATLVRGSNYALKFQGDIYRWSEGEEKQVSKELSDYLAETALDVVSVNNGDNDFTNETRPKFTYRTE